MTASNDEQTVKIPMTGSGFAEVRLAINALRPSAKWQISEFWEG
jgi:hypothetical protein